MIFLLVLNALILWILVALLVLKILILRLYWLMPPVKKLNLNTPFGIGRLPLKLIWIRKHSLCKMRCYFSVYVSIPLEYQKDCSNYLKGEKGMITTITYQICLANFVYRNRFIISETSLASII